MQLLISGVHVDTGDAFRTHVKDSLDAFNVKHGIDPVEVSVAITKEVVYKFRIDITYRMGRGILIHGYGEGEDPHFSFENAMHMLAERIRRQKKRLVAHHKQAGGRLNPHAPYYVLGAEEPEEISESDNESLAPPVIAELTAEVPTLTVGEAVMRLDLSQQPAMMFYNESHGRLNMVYRRADGNVGWVDPAEATH
jgi:ribosomal subunit interface protein